MATALANNCPPLQFETEQMQRGPWFVRQDKQNHERHSLACLIIQWCVNDTLYEFDWPLLQTTGGSESCRMAGALVICLYLGPPLLRTPPSVARGPSISLFWWGGLCCGGLHLLQGQAIAWIGAQHYTISAIERKAGNRQRFCILLHLWLMCFTLFW